jgi:hypothetical protein
MKDRRASFKPLAFAIATAGLIASSADAQFVFSVGATYAVGKQPDWAAVADLNGDGYADIAVTAEQGMNNDAVAVLLGDGSGAFAAPYYVFLPSSSSPGAVVAGDLDGDKDIDLAVGLKDYNQVIILKNSGSGTFASSGTFATGAEPRGMDMADADGDGDLDLVVANREGNTVTYLGNDGSGTFATMSLAAGLEPRDAVFGDFDNDGDQDIAVSNHDDRTIRTFINSAGAFAIAATFSVGSSDRAEGMDTGDLNGDGRDDIVAASGDDEGLNGNRAIVFLSNSASSFSGPAYFSTNALDTSDVIASDLDCDGDLDLAAANELGNSVTLKANNGSASFGTSSFLGTGSNPDMVADADLDGDGDADLITVNRNSNNISVFINDTCAPPKKLQGDCNYDGVVNVDDLLGVIGDWGSCPGCPTDMVVNEFVDVDDLMLVISNWS